MSIIIISGFETYSERVQNLYDFFSKKDDVKIILSDFSHVNKEKIVEKISYTNTIYVRTRPYKKNISFSRVLSHYLFAKDVYKILMNEDAHIIYSLIPPNFLVYYLNKIARKKNDSKVILDIIDLWPETFPITKFKKNPIFSIWGKIRSNNLKYPKLLITECDLFIKKIPQKFHFKTETLYLGRKNKKVNWNFNGTKNDRSLDLCYLGSINNIINIDFIVNLCAGINHFKKVTLHIVGDGERLGELIEKLKHHQINYISHGKVYNSVEKEKIFKQCHFALNIMKKDVFVGLTMKSIDYFQHGLPLINTIEGDSKKIVNNYECGINYSYDNDNMDDFSKYIASLDFKTLMQMKEQSRLAFEELFTQEEFEKKLHNLLTKHEVYE